LQIAQHGLVRLEFLLLNIWSLLVVVGAVLRIIQMAPLEVVAQAVFAQEQVFQ
jgi:hypothetical protein